MTQDSDARAPADGDEALAAVVRRWAYAAVSAREMSSAMLTRRLADKAARRFPDSEPEARRRAVTAAVTLCVGHGFVDDARFADLSVRGGVARGHSRRRIALTLKEKGVGDAVDLADVDDLASALRLLRRRRLGPWADEASGDDSTSEESDAEDCESVVFSRKGRLGARPEDRALGLLVRNGFALDIARRALAMPREEAERRLEARD